MLTSDKRKSNRRYSPPYRAPKSSSAFTLAEVLITLALGLITIVGIMELLAYTRTVSRLNEDRSQASALAATEMESLKRQLFTHLHPSTESVILDDNRTPEDPSDDKTATLQVVLKDIDGNVMTGYPTTNDRVQAEIIVSWNASGRMSSQVFSERMTTLIAP